MPRKKRGPGHPITTGSASVPPVFYRVSKEQHAELKAEAEATGITPNEVAKRRAFPTSEARPRPKAAAKSPRSPRRSP